MAVITHLETDTGTNVDISAATAVGAYTANGDKLIMVDVSIDAVAGNGDYVMYVTRQIGGSGSAYRILPQTTMAAASGLTAISAQSGWITVRNGDVLTCYVDGLAGDTSTPDWSTRWFESAVTLVTLADDAITAAKFDESTAFPLKSADTGATAVARTGADSDTLETLSDQMDADVTLASTQGAITWGQQKIVANVANEGALDIKNLNANGVGLRNWGTKFGLVNLATGASSFGQLNESQGASGTGMANNASGTTSKGLVNNGTAQDVDGYDPALALEATLTAMKGTGWTNETLVAIDVLIAAIKAKTDNLPADPADDSDIDAQLAAIKAETALIVEDTGTTIPATLANLALEATLTAIKGAGWSNGTLQNIKNDTDAQQTTLSELQDELADGGRLDLLIDAIKAKTDNLPADPADDSDIDAAIAAVKSVVDDILVDTGTTLDTLVRDIPTNAELTTALGTADDAVLAAIAAAKVVIDDIHNTDLPAVKAETALIVEDTGMTLPATLGPINEYDANFTQLVDLLNTIMGGEAWTDETLVKIASNIAGLPIATAQQVWIYPTRTLIQPGISLITPATGSELILYKDATNVISLSGLGDLTNRTEVWFTIKANLDMPDDDAILQVTETGNLQHINQISGGDLGIDIPDVTMAVTDDGQATITISAEAGQALPVMQVTPVEWDLKVAFSDGTVIPIQVGTAYIKQTATRAIS